jgi:IMP cyclohydrolase
MEGAVAIFKNTSKKTGNPYHTAKVTTVLDGVVIETNGFLKDYQVEQLKEKGHKVIEFEKK